MSKRDAFLKYSIFFSNVGVMKSYLRVYFAIVGKTNRVCRSYYTFFPAVFQFCKLHQLCCILTCRTFVNMGLFI